MHEEKHSLVSHRYDPRFLALRSLQSTPGRSHSGLYLIEGIRHVARALEHHTPIQSLFVDPSILSNPFGRKLARRLRKSGVPSLQLSRRLYRELTLAAAPQGIGAVVRQRWAPLASARPEGNSFWLAVESIDSPGNLGTIVRTAEATGVAGIFLIGDADPFDPAAVRASMGSLFSQKLVKCTAREFIDWKRSSGSSVIASSPTGLLDYRALRYRWPAVLLMGSEKHGLSEHLIDASDFTVRLPMLGSCDSVNVAVAAGVLLYEMFNQRRGV